MGLFGGDSVIGLDLGSSALKGVKVQMVRGRWTVTAATTLPTPPGALNDGVVTEPTLLLPALRELGGRLNARGAQVVTATNYTSAVVVQRTAAPLLKPDRFRRLLHARPDQFGISAGEDRITDFDVLGAQAEGENAQMDVMLVTSPRAPIETRMQAIEAAGFDAIAMDVEPLALMRSLVECKPHMVERPGSLAILDLGAKHTDVTVVRGPSFIFTRSIPGGGAGMTEVIRQAVQCQPEHAEELKRSVDLRWLLEGPGLAADTEAYKATAGIKPTLDELLKEVNNSLVFWHAQLPEDDMEGMVDTIVLAGGTAHLQGLVEYMQSAFSQRVERATLGEGFAYPIACRGEELPPDSGTLYALAMGLAVKEPMDRARAEQAAAARKARAKRPGRGHQPPQAAAA